MPDTSRATSLRPLALSFAFLLGTGPFFGAAYAQSTEARHYDITQGSLAESIKQFARQSGLQILAPPELTGGLRAPQVNGDYSQREALERLLAGSGLAYEFVNANTVVIGKAPSATKPKTPPVAKSAAQSDNASTPITLDTMTVTGTRIRGGASPSQVITITDQQIREEGFSDLGEVIRDVPQNYNGGQNPGVNSVIGGAIANQNITGGSALDLRGLGPDATLTLLNGRRLVYDGFVQAIDISAIPAEAVARIEIVPDGASAIYGSDAVAGVANVVLKRDFDGVTIGSRYGTSTQGGLTTHDYFATIGTTWSGGGVIATYKDSSSDPIDARQRDYSGYMYEPNALFNGTDLHSGLLSAHQSLGDAVELRLDALQTERNQQGANAYDPTEYYDGGTKTTVALVSPSVAISLPGDWSMTVGGTYGRDKSTYLTRLITVPEGVSTLDSYGYYGNLSHSYEIGAEGPLFSLSGGDARLAVGAGYREDEFANGSYLSTYLEKGDQNSRYVYSEINLPLVGPESGIAGIQRLIMTAAVRGEDYDTFGRVATPKLGLVYEPNADFTLKTSWGKSFKAPTLFQQYFPSYGYLWSASSLGGIGYPADATVLMSYGGNTNLKPERAKTWAQSFAFHPASLPGLETELSYFDIDYKDRVVQPINALFQALSDPNYAQFVNYSPTEAEKSAIASVYNFYNYVGAAYDASKVVAIVADQYVNVASQRVKGIDLSGSYRFDLGNGRLTIRGSASWLDSTQQNSSGQSAYDLAGTIFNPAKIKGRVGVVWNEGGFSASGFVNYAGGVTSLLTGSEEKIASFTTADFTLRYDVGPRGDAFSGTEIALSAQNLFDRDPPLYNAIAIARSIAPFDSTNYSAIGRFLSVSVSKHW